MSLSVLLYYHYIIIINPWDVRWAELRESVTPLNWDIFTPVSKTVSEKKHSLCVVREKKNMSILLIIMIFICNVYHV